MECDIQYISDLLIHQIKNFWLDIDEEEIRNAIPSVVATMREGYYEQVNASFLERGMNPYNSVQWCVFLYRMSRFLYVNRKENNTRSADVLFYLNKIMNSVNWNYKADLPAHFSCEHPLGSVLGRAKYSDYLFIYQGVTVGGNRSKDEIKFPVLGRNIILYTDSKIIGDSCVGNNVVVAANTYIFNSKIPDNCIVSGESPDLVIREKREEDIQKYTSHIWKWEKNPKGDRLHE